MALSSTHAITTHTHAIEQQDVDSMRFSESHRGDLYFVERAGFLFTSTSELASSCAEAMKRVCESLGETWDDGYEGHRPSVRSFSPGNVSVRAGSSLLATFRVRSDMNPNDPFEVKRMHMTIVGRGNGPVCRAFKEAFLDMVPMSTNEPVVTWRYTTKEGFSSVDVVLSEAAPICREFYPWLGECPYNYIDRYIASNAPVLLLRGEPGTGKTSFIRNLLWRARKNALVTYDQNLFMGDQLFVDFITSRHQDVMVMEDADSLLVSREDDQNSAMNKFLNVSDGLIRFPEKRMIITSNVMDTDRIDSALMRPGRCFDAPVFRKLTPSEARAAARVAGRPEPRGERDISLAELFSDDPSKTGPVRARRLGFVGHDQGFLDAS